MQNTESSPDRIIINEKSTFLFRNHEIGIGGSGSLIKNIQGIDIV